MELIYIFFVDMDYDGVMFTESYIVIYLRENRVDHLIFTSNKSVLKLVVLQNATIIYDMRIRAEVRKNI